jgi:enterochelin esterase-like enzyme
MGAAKRWWDSWRRNSYPGSLVKFPYVKSLARTACVLGASLGGLAALWLGVRVPELFGRVLSQAGGFMLGGATELGLTTILRLRERVPLRIYLDCGRFDPLLEANRLMKGLLEARGYEVAYHEFNAGHNYPAWREDLSTGLSWLYRDCTESIL